MLHHQRNKESFISLTLQSVVWSLKAPVDLSVGHITAVDIFLSGLRKFADTHNLNFSSIGSFRIMLYYVYEHLHKCR